MNEPTERHNRLLMLLWLIPVILLGYIGWMNFLPAGGITTYLLDIGGQDISGDIKLTGPFDRISDSKESSGIDFREIQKNLVYFELESSKLKRADEIEVKVKFKDNIPTDARFMIGAKDKEEWSYLWKDIYVPFYSTLTQLNPVASEGSTVIYETGRTESVTFQSLEDFFNEPPIGSVIATNDHTLSINRVADVQGWSGLRPENQSDVGGTDNPNKYENGYLLISTTLRGAHTLWTYVDDGFLSLVVTKQDLNWYEGADELTIKVYSIYDELMCEAFISDENNESNDKKLGPLQSESLNIDKLQSGSYRIELTGNSDLLIRRIEINQERLVIEKRMFLIGMNVSYFKDGLTTDPITIYGRSFGSSLLRSQTYHASGLQNINVSQDDRSKLLQVNDEGTWFDTNLISGNYQLTIPKQDVIIEYAGYMSFTPDSFFIPKRVEIVELKFDLSWLSNNVDYVIVNHNEYSPPTTENGWLIGETSWKIKDLYILDNKLSFCFNAPHLEKEPERIIPVEWIEITIKTLPIWERNP